MVKAKVKPRAHELRLTGNMGFTMDPAPNGECITCGAEVPDGHMNCGPCVLRLVSG